MVFGSESADRLLKVLATQSCNPYVTELRMTALLDPTINPFGVMPDVLAIAPYFGGGMADDLVSEGGGGYHWRAGDSGPGRHAFKKR